MDERASRIAYVLFGQLISRWVAPQIPERPAPTIRTSKSRISVIVDESLLRAEIGELSFWAAALLGELADLVVAEVLADARPQETVELILRDLKLARQAVRIGAVDHRHVAE